MSSTPDPRFDIFPLATLTDEPVSIVVRGLPPGVLVRLRARTHDDDFGRLWESWADFQADENGIVDPSEQAPVDGSYAGVDGMGLVWSMELDPAAEEECYFRKRDLNPIGINLTAEIDGQVVSRATIQRWLVGADVVQRSLRENGLVGEYFLPGGDGPFPGVIVLGGGDGGVLLHGAALLASRGYAALALGYFNLEGLPAAPVEIPLEYFGEAIEWLQSQPEVQPAGVAMTGTSLGGLYGLLAAAYYPEVHAFAGYVPMGILLEAHSEQRSPATWQGNPLPALRVDGPTAEDNAWIEAQVRAGESVSFAFLLLRALQDTEAAAKADIPAERINGALLLMTGGNDLILPPPVSAARVVARLQEFGFQHPYQHIEYPGAGHAIGLPHAHGLPFVPTYGRAPKKHTGPLPAFGGNKADNARANIESWQALLAFLKNVSSR